MDIWQWTLTKEAIAPCFVRDVLDMRQSGSNADFFWLGYTPCRSVLLVGMVVAVQTYDKRTIYTVDDGTAVIDCVLRHPILPAQRSAPPLTRDTNAKPNVQRPNRVNGPVGPPPPVTEPGYPVRVIGKVMRHYESKQIYAESIDPCPSSLDEIAHLERVVELHKTKYSLPIPFVPPSKPASRAPPPDTSTWHPDTGEDANIFSGLSLPGPSTASHTLPVPPRMPVPLQDPNRPPLVQTHVRATDLGHIPSSPTASIASSTPSSPCKPSSPIKPHETESKPKLRHPSRLHSRDLTANTFRLYVKHYMDNAPPPFSVLSSLLPFQGTCGNVTTPTKRTRFGEDEIEGDETTPRPRPRHYSRSHTNKTELNDHDEDGQVLGFTLSHLRRVPELALLAARVVRVETRKREKVERDKLRNAPQTTSGPSSRPNGRGAVTELPRKKMKRLFSWAVVKLYEEGSIVLWDGEVRPLPVPPPPAGESANTISGLWNDHTNTPVSIDPSMVSTCGSTSVLFNSSASASLYSHYHAPRKRDGESSVSELDDDVDPASLSDPGLDEEAYVPLNAQFLAGYVGEALDVLRCGRVAAGRGRTKSVTAEEVLKCLQRMDGRWARVGIWAVDEALAVLRAG